MLLTPPPHTRIYTLNVSNVSYVIYGNKAFSDSDSDSRTRVCTSGKYLECHGWEYCEL